MKFFGHLDLAPGSYSLRVLVLQRDFARMGLRIVPLELAVGADAADLASLELVEAESWHLVMESGSADFPLLSGDQPVIPATRPPTVTSETVAEGKALAEDKLQTSRAEVRRRRDVVAGYVAALQLLIQGREASAIQALTALERAGLAGEVEVVFVPSLMALASRLAEQDRESLVPLIQVHEKVYRQHYLKGDYRLATHARLMAVGLVEIYNKSFRTPDPAAGVFTARVFASLGGFLQQLGSVPQARVVFEEALRQDPTSVAALLGLASIDEAFDDANAAIERLQGLLEIRPDHAEGRLRLAVNLRRQGTLRKAADLFRAVLEAASPSADWIRVVAYQELARLYVTQERFDDAAALLIEALEWRPGHQRFYIQLAALHDHMEEGVQSRQVLARLDPEAGRRRATPRLVYSRWPSSDIEATRRRLAEAAAGRLENLAEALGAVTGTGGES